MLKYEVNKLRCHKLADRLLKALNEREKCLMKGECIVSAVFLDPRFKMYLNQEKCTMARVHIISAYKRLCSIPNHEIQNIIRQTYVPEPLSDTDMSDQPFEKMLEARFGRCGGDESQLTHSERFERELHDYDVTHRSRLPVKAKILDFWKEIGPKFPLLKYVSTVILAAPATQVSVERCFSTLKYVLSDLRTSLSEQKLEDILLIKINHNFENKEKKIEKKT